MNFLTVVFHDDVVQQISDQVAAFPPERGGLLVGPPGVPVISDFLVDEDARMTGVTFQLSYAVEHRLHEYEHAGLALKGVVHSHPSGLLQPSLGDEGTFVAQLDRMPHLPYLITPIVTNTHGPVQRHQIALPGRGVMSVFTASRALAGRVSVSPVPASVLPVQKVLMDLATWGAVGIATRPNYVSMGGQQYAGLSLTLPNGRHGTLLLPPGYPMTTPILLEEGGHVPIVWDLRVNESERLIAALDSAALTTSVVGESQASDPKGLRDPETDPDGGLGVEEIRTGLRARLEGTVSLAITEKRVLVVGLGSGGSQTVDALVRASMENLTVIDPDKVEAVNLSRSVYIASDVGSTKVAAIARHAASINPGVRIAGYTKALDEFTPEQLAELVNSVDMVVAATDDPEAQYRLNHVAYQAGKPAVFAGVYERGSAGEVVFTFPAYTACFRCATAGKRGGSRGTATINYGTGTLVAEPALGADITHVVSASAKIIIGLLELLEEPNLDHSSALMVATALNNGTNFLQLAMVPNYEGFGTIFRGVPGQLAYQSLWIGTSTNPDCPVCGEHPVPHRMPEHVDVDSVAAFLADASDGSDEKSFVIQEDEFIEKLGDSLPAMGVSTDTAVSDSDTIES